MMNLKTKIKFFPILLLLIICNIPALAQLTPEQVHDKISGSVVIIKTIDENNNWMGEGSGVFVDSTGTIWTNFHLFNMNCSFEISNEFRSYIDCKIIGADPDRDILILKVSGIIDNYITPDIGRTKKKGAKVFAYGNPLSKYFTFSEGIISNFTDVKYNNQTYIQFTASISSGSSGGALVNEYGELIGITNSTFIRDNSQNLNNAVMVEDYLKTEIVNDTAIDLIYDFCMASQYEIDGNINEALSRFEKLSEHFPDNDYIYSKRGRCCLQLERYKEAVELYDKAIDLNSNNSGYYRDRGYSKMLDSNFIGARSDLEYSLQLDPEDGFTLTYLAILESDYLGRHQKALDLCNSAIITDSWTPYFYRVKGNIYLNMKDTTSALTAFWGGLYVDSLDIESLYLVAELSSHQKNYYDVITSYSTLLRADEFAEDDPDIYFNRGIAYRNQRKLRNAIEDLTNCVNLSKHNPKYYVTMGYLYLENEEYEKSNSSFKKARNINREDWEPYLGHAISSYNSGEQDEAIDYFKKAVKLNLNIKKGMSEIRRINHTRALYWNYDELLTIEKLLVETGMNQTSPKNKKSGKDNKSSPKADAPAK